MPLSMFALRLCGDTDDADDIVQEAFMKIWENTRVGRHNPRHQGIPLPAPCATAPSAVCRVTARPLGIEAMADVPDEEIDTSERDARLWEAIGRLPERCREIFLMSKRDGMPNAEIAEELGISVKTVENQMTKAFRQLRATLTPGPTKVFFLPFL